MPHGRLLLVFAFLFSASTLRSAEKSDFFESKVRPLLAQHCYSCHSSQAKKLRAGLRVDSRDALLAGGDGGPALVPGQPEKSRLIEAIAYKNVDLQMPPRGQLSPQALADLTAWVKMGAPWPKETSPEPTGGTKSAFDLQERKKSHWAWQPIRPQSPPTVRDANWPRNSLDRFVLAKLEEKGLTPAKPADRRTLLRRLYFDLTGLPPAPEQLQAFLRDDSSDAIEKVVDRLLASPHFGERWGRHWLDLMRYAETRGHEFDFNIPNAYQYRDYVIRALNADLPYNQFVLEHLAGDLLPKPRLNPNEGYNESILGTSFWFLGEEVHSPVDIRQDQADRFDNKVDVLSKAFLGLTVACARCHDHKFDAISTKDYYSLFGFLQSSHYRLARFDSMEHNRAVAGELWAFRAKSRATIQKAAAEALRPGAERVAEYLSAARTALLARADSPMELSKIANEAKLDASRLNRWMTALRKAEGDDGDPLHVWTQGSRDAQRTSAPRAPLRAAADQTKEEARVILDFARNKPGEWITDGFAFGPGPVRPGDLQVGGDAAKPTVHLSEYTAAEKDATWDVLTTAPGTENDPGSLGHLVRAGKTLYTPTFPLTTGKVYYLVKGKGFVHAAIGSHIMLAGPLHGQLTRNVTAGDRFQWIEHDLSAYRGQIAHLEFTPAGSAPFAVAQVVEGKAPPTETTEVPKPPVDSSDTAGLAPPLAESSAIQRRFSDALNALSSNRLVGSSDAVSRARLVNWMIAHADLFGSTNPAADEARAFLAQEAKIVERIRKESRLCVALIDGSQENEYVFIRGSHKTRGETVPRRFLEALSGPAPLSAPRGSGRLELAQKMIDPAVDPFLPRVLVNRAWHHLFGRGIVASTDNFGVLGERPTHPELLDYLAGRFVQEGWSIKKLIRGLVLSSTYRMDSRPNQAADRADPDDLLLHRTRMRRLEGETIRDAILSVSGRLDPHLYGPSVLVHLTAFQQGRGRPASGPLDGNGRRSVYLSVRRNFLSPFLLAFDTPSPFSTVGRRTTSNVPAQSLILLNDPFVHEQAQLWAKRVMAQPGSTRDKIAGMYESAFARAPSESELASCLDFVEPRPSGRAKDNRKAWTDLAHVLFNVKEFIFVN